MFHRCIAFAIAASALTACAGASSSVSPPVAGSASPSAAPSASPSTRASRSTTASPSPSAASAPTPEGLEVAIAIAQACTTQVHRGLGPSGSRVDFARGARVELRDDGRVAITFVEESNQARQQRTLVIDAAQRTCDGAPIALTADAFRGANITGSELVSLARACAERAPVSGRGIHGSPLVWERAHVSKRAGEVGTTRWTVYVGEQTVATPSGRMFQIETRDGTCEELRQLD